MKIAMPLTKNVLATLNPNVPNQLPCLQLMEVLKKRCLVQEQ